MKKCCDCECHEGSSDAKESADAYESAAPYVWKATEKYLRESSEPSIFEIIGEDEYTGVIRWNLPKMVSEQ